MLFDPEEIDRLSPAARIEVQEFYARKFLAERAKHDPERRAARPSPAASSRSPTSPSPADSLRPWPRVWFRNDSTRPTARRY